MILKMSSDKSLVITSHGNTYEDESNAEVIRVLLPKTINGTDIKDCTVWLNFVNADGRGEPIDLTKHLVEHSDTYYMAEIQMTRKLTDMPGESQFWIEITSASSDMLARTNKVSHLIKPHINIADVLPEESVPVLYEILQKLDDLYNSGGIDPNELKKQIVSAVESYLIKNPVSITETDPTVPSWAKQPNKPTYHTSEIITNNKTTVESELQLKADKSETYTKEEVNAIHTQYVNKAIYNADMMEKADTRTVDAKLFAKVDKTDDSLNTNNKTIVGAINEILDKYNVIPDWAKTQTKPAYNANEVGTYSRDEIDEWLCLKADVYNTYTKDEIDSIVSNIECGGGGDFVETDPTVPDWAKEPNKPKYTADEVGAYGTKYVDDEFRKTNDLISGHYIETKTLGATVEGLQKQITEEAHFRGYLSTNAKIQALQATPNDFAYSAESGTKWVYDIGNGWQDTGKAVPDQLTPASDSTPRMNGEASVGQENAYARGDHIHPHDETKADKSDTFTKTEVENLINSAIGEALRGEY